MLISDDIHAIPLSPTDAAFIEHHEWAAELSRQVALSFGIPSHIVAAEPSYSAALITTAVWTWYARSQP